MLLERIERRLRERDARDLRRHRRIVESACAPHQVVSRDESSARSMLAFCSNDYLGLANHPALIAALAEGASRYGAGSGASHLINGHHRAHETFEARIAAWYAPHIPEARALFFGTGYLANIGVLTALGGADATIFSEQLNHASLIDGARLARAEVVKLAHRDVHALDAALAACTTPERVIVTDAVFSMDGDLAPLPAMLECANRHDAWLVIDDAHGFGVLGARGHGALAHFGLGGERIVYMGTLGKAAGVAGAFVVAHRTVIDWLIQIARTYIYTTASPPAIAHALLTSLTLIDGDEGEQRRARLHALIDRLRTRLPAALAGHAWRLADSPTAIQPLIVGCNADALALAAALEAENVLVPAIRPPTVAEGTARLRITLSASHTFDDVDRLIDAIARASRAFAQRSAA